MNALAEIRRRLDNMIRSGTVAAVDHANALCRVQSGQILTGWLPFFTVRAGSTNEWNPVSVGEQCTVLSPSGDLAQGQVLVGLYSAANPPCSHEPDAHKTLWANGDYVEHRAGSGNYSLKLTGHVQIDAASLTINCGGAIKLTGATIDLN